MRRQARAWVRAYSPQVKIATQPADLKPDGLVQLELAFQKAVAAVEATELQKS
jgi:hypothetical protein